MCISTTLFPLDLKKRERELTKRAEYSIRKPVSNGELPLRSHHEAKRGREEEVGDLAYVSMRIQL
jgi:hypothetical protein